LALIGPQWQTQWQGASDIEPAIEAILAPMSLPGPSKFCLCTNFGSIFAHVCLAFWSSGITPGEPEVFEPSPHSEFTGFDGQQHKAGTTGSPIRFGSAGGGAPACPGFLNWGQPFADLLLHPKIVPFLTEFLVSPQATKRSAP